MGALAPILRHPRRCFRKEAAWGISNILAGPYQHIQAVFEYNNGEILDRLFEMANIEEFEV